MFLTLNVTREIFENWIKVAKATREADNYYDTPHGRRYISGEIFPPIVARVTKFYNREDNEVKCGWVTNDDVTQYTTCGGNTWGMKEEGDKYIAYFSGRRSRIKDFINMMKDSDPSFKKEMAKVTIHESAAPADMKWWEIKDEYLARKEAEKAAAKKRAQENRRKSDRRFAKENNPFSILKGIKAK
nr:MAG TPA: hypothetical protein [Caudoviricetes sp.]